MTQRFPAAIVGSVTVVLPGLVVQMPTVGQQIPAPAQKGAGAASATANSTAPAKSVVSRTPWGGPDLQGIYTLATTTPIEPPKALGNKGFYTEDELAVLEKRVKERVSEEGKTPRPRDTGTYNNFWISSDKGRLTGRTSIITDSPDGRMPPLTERVQTLQEHWAAKDAAGGTHGNMHIVEQFTRIDVKPIDYRVTVDDPTTWTKPWTFVLPWRGDDPGYQQPEDLFEYACHEGNFRMMEDTLAGTRALKAEAQRGSSKQQPVSSDRQ